MPIRQPLSERFWSKVSIPVDRNPDVCWEWNAALTASGYGELFLNGVVYAHRLAYELHHATKIPEGLFVCHSCDNRKCCNPAHLWLGTNEDNMRDMRKKGRSASGESNGRAKFSDAQIEQVFELRQKGLLHREIADIIGMSRRNVGFILSGKFRKRR